MRIEMALLLILPLLSLGIPVAAGPVIGRMISLDSRDKWVVSPDPKNLGKQGKWWAAPRPDAKPIRVPGIMQEALGEYHGVAWYWREIAIPRNPHPNGRYVLRFWSIDYYAEVWVNGHYAGNHECADAMFELDITGAVKPGSRNVIAVRVINPSNEPIEGFRIGETPGRNRVDPWPAACCYNSGGIQDSVELLVTSPVRVRDLYVKPNWKTGAIEVDASVTNTLNKAVKGRLILSVAPAFGGEPLDLTTVAEDLKPGDTLVKASVKVDDIRLWNPSDPYLYRVSARLEYNGSNSIDEKSTTCGFRDLRFEDGYFRLNGKRIFLKSAHFGGDSPGACPVPLDPDLVRKDFLNLKTMRFNMARCIAGLGRRQIMDLADEIGLMVYDECYAGWCLVPSPKMPERYDKSVAGMIKRDRNHPCVVLWGMLNEMPDNPVFRHAVASLKFVKSLDDTRVVMLNSCRTDGQISESREEAAKQTMPQAWSVGQELDIPLVACNTTGSDIYYDGTTFPAGKLAMHVGVSGEPAVLRFTAPADGAYQIRAFFQGIAGSEGRHDTTGAVHVLVNGETVFSDKINCDGRGNETAYEGKAILKKGQTIDVLSGSGNAAFNSDTTRVDLTITGPDGKAHDATSDWSISNKNPNGVWTYGYLTENGQDASKFAKLSHAYNGCRTSIGSLSNPGASDWQDLLADKHPYQQCPHTAPIIHALRTINGGDKPLFLSEYGFGSANNLFHLVGHYDQLDVGYVYDRHALDGLYAKFADDWKRWNLADTFGNMENYSRKCIAMEAEGRLLGTSAIRSNPNVISHSLTACHDTVLAAEGLITSFREPKPGVHDAMCDAWSPLRFCVFAEPVQVYKGGTAHVEAVLVNEDVLRPGRYPVRVQVVGPGGYYALDTSLTIDVPAATSRPEPPYAKLVFAQDIRIDGPAGEYKLFAFFDKGAAAEGGEYTFWVDDESAMPAVTSTVTLWGEDKGLATWLASRGIKTRPFAADQTEPEVILVGNAVGDFAELTRHIERGSAAVFLSPSVFAKGDNPTAMLPLKNKGSLVDVVDWLYNNNDWAKDHPVFAGLPKGLLDYQFYREILGERFWSGLDVPDEIISGMINTSLGYHSGLTVCAYKLGEGKLLLNSLHIRENLSAAASHPVAERLLRNMLVWAEK